MADKYIMNPFINNLSSSNKMTHDKNEKLYFHLTAYLILFICI